MKKKLITTLLAAVCAVTMVTVFPTAKVSATQKAEPTKISIMTQTYGDPPSDTNRIIKEIQESTNTKLDITWAPAASYSEKFVMTIASGQMPMMLLITDDKHATYADALKQGAFWEVGPSLKDYKNLNALSKNMWKNAQAGGKNYLIPRYRAIARNGILYRQDWAEAAGIKTPTNMDELYNMIKAFGTGDYDKNGQKDSVGLVLDSSNNFTYIMSVFGASTGWGTDKDGNVVPNFAETEYLNGLTWLRKLYAEKLINQDFAVLQNSKQLFSKGNAGVWGNISDDIRSTEILKDLPTNVKTAKVDVLYQLTGPKGIRNAATSAGYYGGFVIPKTTVKDEATLKKVLSFMDYLSSGKAVNILNYGQEGVDYKVENGSAIQTPEQKTAFTAEIGSIGQLNLGDFSQLLKPANEVDARVYKMWDELNKTTVLDPTASLSSPTWAKISGEINKIATDAKVKYIMGVMSEQQYKDAVKKWYDAGGTQVCKEFTEALKAAK